MKLFVRTLALIGAQIRREGNYVQMGCYPAPGARAGSWSFGVVQMGCRAKRPDNGVPLGNSAHPDVRTHLGTQPYILRPPLVGWWLRVRIMDMQV
jgi:hypothetical protein